MENDNITTDKLIQRLEQVYKELEIELQQPTVMDRLRHPARENEWSAMQTLGHMVEMIPYWLHDCQMLIASIGNPPQFGRSIDAPERLEGVENGAAKDPDELMRLLKDEIKIATETIRAMSTAERGKKGIHIRKGEMTIIDILESFVVSHAEDHLTQVRNALRS